MDSGSPVRDRLSDLELGRKTLSDWELLLVMSDGVGDGVGD